MIQHSWIVALMVVLTGCSTSNLKPVDIFPEDICSFCRMAISDDAFAAEIITTAGDVYKFDDIGCMDRFERTKEELIIGAQFVKDLDSKAWIPYGDGFIVLTGIKTPMGSGKVAFADSAAAAEFTRHHPPMKSSVEKKNCCAGGHE
jgi:copper chaperone NosL